MTRRLGCLSVVWVVLVFGAAGVSRAQGRGAPAWTTSSGDAQRTSWVRTDSRISRTSMQKPGFQFLWKAKLENQPKQLNSLTQPLLLPNIISYKGFKALAFVGGSSDNVYSIDSDLNKLFWKRHLNTAASARSSSESLSCPGGLTALTRFTPLPQPAPPAGAPAGRGGGGGGGRGGNQNVFAISSDGMAHALNPQTGEDFTPPIAFLPPNAKAVGAVLIDNILYAATADNCGGAPNAVWAVDVASNAKVPVYWESKGGGVAGTANPTIGTGGTVYVATGDGEYSETAYSDAVVSLDPKTLTLTDWFTPGKTPFTSSPVAFQYNGKDLIVAANADGRLYVLDSASLGGTDHRTPLYKTAPYSKGADFAPGALSTWQDADGTRWVLAASGGPIADTTFPNPASGSVTNGSIVAFKVVDQNGTPALEPGWVSRDMISPLPPAIVNGVVFALSSGEYRTSDATMSAADRARRSKPAVLYALDAATGRELWNSGSTITSFVHGVGPSAGDGQVYVVTYDGTVYAFGIPLEH